MVFKCKRKRHSSIKFKILDEKKSLPRTKFIFYVNYALILKNKEKKMIKEEKKKKKTLQENILYSKRDKGSS